MRALNERKRIMQKQTKLSTTKDLADKLFNKFAIFLCEVIMSGLAIQGMLSVIHTTEYLQVGFSVSFILALLIIRFRTK